MLMSFLLSDYILPVSDLMERPGASREVDLALPVPRDFELPLASIEDPVRLDGVVESVVDGLLVRGQLESLLGLGCARCLRPLQREVDVSVVELFLDPAKVDPSDEIEGGYELMEGVLSLETLLRDALSATIPYRPLCMDECRGLCVECGANLNETQCACAETVTDPRWEALRGLRLPDDGVPDQN